MCVPIMCDCQAHHVETKHHGFPAVGRTLESNKNSLLWLAAKFESGFSKQSISLFISGLTSASHSVRRKGRAKFLYIFCGDERGFDNEPHK